MNMMDKPPREIKEVEMSDILPGPVTVANGAVDIVPGPVARAKPPFTLDLEHMAAQGFYTPSDQPQRLALELRAIKRRLMRRLEGRRDAQRPANLVLVTSTRPAEGKTFNAINLALSFALEDAIGTVLVDGDLPRPKVLEHFGLETGPGLVDLIEQAGAVHLRECLWRAADTPLAILGSGRENTQDQGVFTRPGLRQVLHEISARFPDRLILIDAPPVLASSEALLLAPHMDEVLFVVEANGTPEPAVATALDELLEANERVSLVLNRCLVADDAIHYGSYKEYYKRHGRDDV